MSKRKDSVRLYGPHNGDIFSILEKHAFAVMSKNGTDSMFIPIKRYKKIIWYKPSTWFRWFWQIEYRVLNTH